MGDWSALHAWCSLKAGEQRVLIEFLDDQAEVCFSEFGANDGFGEQLMFAGELLRELSAIVLTADSPMPRRPPRHGRIPYAEIRQWLNDRRTEQGSEALQAVIRARVGE